MICVKKQEVPLITLLIFKLYTQKNKFEKKKMKFDYQPFFNDLLRLFTYKLQTIFQKSDFDI